MGHFVKSFADVKIMFTAFPLSNGGLPNKKLDLINLAGLVLNKSMVVSTFYSIVLC